MIKIKSEEEQVLEHFIETCESLTEEVYHADPRGEEGYYTTEFHKKKAKELFYEIKNYFTK